MQTVEDQEVGYVDIRLHRSDRYQDGVALLLRGLKGILAL